MSRDAPPRAQASSRGRLSSPTVRRMMWGDNEPHKAQQTGEAHRRPGQGGGQGQEYQPQRLYRQAQAVGGLPARERMSISLDRENRSSRATRITQKAGSSFSIDRLSSPPMRKSV